MNYSIFNTTKEKLSAILFNQEKKNAIAIILAQEKQIIVCALHRIETAEIATVLLVKH